MKRTVQVFGLDIQVLTAKEAMKAAIRYLEEETANTIEIVTLETLMNESANEQWREQMQQMDLLLAGEQALVETTDHHDKVLLRELENRLFLRMFFKYLQKNKKKLFLLAESEAELERMKEILHSYAHSLRVAGQAVLPPDSGLEESIINEINGIEPDCILSGLPSPRGEKFTAESRPLLNARLLVGGLEALSKSMSQKPIERIGKMIRKRVFRYHVEKEKQ